MKSFFKSLAIVLYPLPLAIICSFFFGRMIWSRDWHIGWPIHPDILLVFAVVCFFALRFVYRKYNRELCKKALVRGYLFAVDSLSTAVLLALCMTYHWETFAKFCTNVLPTLSFAILNLGLRLVFHRQDRLRAWNWDREHQRERNRMWNQEKFQ